MTEKANLKQNIHHLLELAITIKSYETVLKYSSTFNITVVSILNKEKTCIFCFSRNTFSFFRFYMTVNVN